MISFTYLVACLVVVASGSPVKPLFRLLTVPRIVGGEDAEPGQFPWQVSFQRGGFGGYDHICGGSVYDETTVITAGHCCAAVGSDARIVAGEHSLNGNDGTEQEVVVDLIRLHADYNEFDLTNDICILKLERALTLTEGEVQAVSLPESLEETTGTLVVSGWGVEDENDGFLPDKLKWAEIPIFSDEACAELYSDFFVQPVVSMICAGEAGKDHCFGDSGGPLVETGTDKLIGIVSWADGCARPGRPGVNTQVSYFIDWIAANSS
jgi:trypsin